VSGLINQSMQNYYFEQIGDTILDARREIKDITADRMGERLDQIKIKMEELVKAYNNYSAQKITINEVIPSELKSYFGMTAEAAYITISDPLQEDGAAEERV